MRCCKFRLAFLQVLIFAQVPPSVLGSLDLLLVCFQCVNCKLLVQLKSSVRSCSSWYQATCPTCPTLSVSGNIWWQSWRSRVHILVPWPPKKNWPIWGWFWGATCPEALTMYIYIYIYLYIYIHHMYIYIYIYYSYIYIYYFYTYIYIYIHIYM